MTHICPFCSCNQSFKTKQQLKNHLLGRYDKGDEFHNVQDPLWTSTAVLAILQNQKRKHTQKRNYDPAKRKTAYEHSRRRTLDNVVRELKQLPLKHPNRQIGLDIIDALTEIDVPQEKKGVVEVGNDRNMMVLLIRDIVTCHDIILQRQQCGNCKRSKSKNCKKHELGNVSYPPKIFHVLDGTESESATFDDVLVGLYASLEKKRLDLSDPSIDLYAAWNIPPSKQGLEKAGLAIPPQITDRGIKINNHQDYSSTITTAGCISPWHIDQCNCGTLILVVDGFKLFIVCPPTEKNRKYFESIDCFGDPSRVKDALNELEQLRYYVVRAGDMFVLPPGELHAVISPVNSAITAWLCHKDDWEKDIDELMQWEKRDRS